jgi:hypothetical protein
MRKYCSPTENQHNFSPPTESQQRNKTTDDETEPNILILLWKFQSKYANFFDIFIMI